MKATAEFLRDLKRAGISAIGWRKCRRGRSFTNCSITIGQRFVDWLSFIREVIPSEIATPARSEESRCENCEVTLRNSSNRALLRSG